MTDLILEKVNEGDSVRLRDGSIVIVEFIAYMPDDLHMDYDYVVRVSGHGAGAYTENGFWSHDVESRIDIIEIVGTAS